MSWLKKIKLWWNGLFSTGERISASPKPEISPAVEIARTPGLNCPECRTRMVVSIQNLVNLDPLICPNCGLELTVDSEKSQSALESLKKLQSGLDEAAKVKQKSLM